MPMLMRLMLAVYAIGATTPVCAVDCLGRLKERLGGANLSMALDDGGLMAFAKMNINIDGSGKAYHRQNRSAGALIHLCNAGDVYLPTGRYTPSKTAKCAPVDLWPISRGSKLPVGQIQRSAQFTGTVFSERDGLL